MDQLRPYCGNMALALYMGSLYFKGMSVRAIASKFSLAVLLTFVQVFLRGKVEMGVFV